VLTTQAFHALVKYTEFAQSYSYATKSCRIEYKCPTAYIQLDGMTTSGLELVRNLRDTKQKKGSLFGTVDYCSTAMGQRLLWTSILQPLSSKTQKDAINNRLDFIELLIGKCTWCVLRVCVSNFVCECFTEVAQIFQYASISSVIFELDQRLFGLPV